MPIELDVSRTVSDDGLKIVGGTAPAVGGGGGGTAGIEVIQLDASGGNVTETLPAPSAGATTLALRVDTSTSNTATLETAGSSQKIRFPEGKDKSSTTLDVEQSLLLSSDGSHWYVEEGQGLSAEAEAVTTDAATKDSPSLTQTATYDSDGTTSVTSSDVSIERYVRTDTDGNATLVYESGGTEIARLTDAGRFETRADQEAFADGSFGSGSSTNSLLQVEDAGTVLTTDAASLNFKGSGVSLTQNGDEVTVDVSGGSNVGSLSDLSDVSSATQSDGSVLASDGTSYSEESVQSLFDSHVSVSASDVSGVSADSVSGAHHAVFEPADYNPVSDVEAHGNALAIDITGDADTLDGVEGGSYARTDQDETFQGTIFGKTFANRNDPAQERLLLSTDAVLEGDRQFNYRLNEDGSRAAASVRHAFFAAGNEIARFQEGGNTGLGGETAPSYALDVNGTGNFSSDLYAGGSVGIGSTNPDYKLYVANGSIRVEHSSSNRYLWFKDTSDSLFQGILFGDSNNSTIGRVQYNHANSKLRFFNNGNRIYFLPNGNFGIGTDRPSYALETSGDMKATGEVEAFLSSDRRLKTGLDPLGSALDKVGQLTGYSFGWCEDGAVQPHKRGETDVGLIAQEVEDVLPEAVKTFKDGHSEGYKSVSYDKLVPLLVEAIKDLRSQVNKLQ
jgi:hypothetical protein